MRVLTRFPDPRAATLAILRAEFPDVTFGTKRLDEFAEGAIPALPYCMVALDASYTRLRVSQRASVRVVVWAETDGEGYDLASAIHAALLAYPGGPDILGFSEMIGPFATDDSDTDRPISSFIVYAWLRPRADS